MRATLRHLGGALRTRHSSGRAAPFVPYCSSSSTSAVVEDTPLCVDESCDAMKGGGGANMRAGKRPVSEANRITMTERLELFRAGPDQKMIFEAGLSNHKRAVIHETCKKMGLKSKSYGRASIGNVQAHSKSEKGLIENGPSSSEKSIVVGCGALSIDYLASVARFPQPDEKIRSVDFKVQGGGNAGNCLTCAARLGLRARVLSKVADDAFGRLVISELMADGVDTSFIEVSKIGTTSFTYVIVDSEMNTRTCINSPGDPPLKPQELPDGVFGRILDDAKILYLDGRLADIALLLADEAKSKGIPVLIDAERKREGLDELLALADYVVCSSKFPQAWTEASTLPEALTEMALRLPDLKFVIVTLGADGCVMLEKFLDGSSELELLNADTEYELLLKKTAHVNASKPSSFASKVGWFQESSGSDDNAKVFAGRFLVGTAELIPSSELVDTTGSGDAFIGAVLYSICTGMRTEEMLCFGAAVAAANCRGLGARTGLPYSHDAKLLPFLGRNE